MLCHNENHRAFVSGLAGGDVDVDPDAGAGAGAGIYALVCMYEGKMVVGSTEYSDNLILNLVKARQSFQTK